MRGPERRAAPGRRPGPEAERGPLLFGPLHEVGLPRYVLLPGDPDRVGVLAGLWDEATDYSLARGYRAAVGRYRGEPLAALSTGMGGPSLEFALTEAAQLGADTFIRVGTTGALQPELRNGDLVVNEGCVRMDGTSQAYVRAEYPAVASLEVTLALMEACLRLGITHHVGVGATTASFFPGQGRANPAGYEAPEGRGVVEEMRRARVLNFEMEGATLLTVARLLGLRAGQVCSVIAHRLTGEWADAGGVERACRVATEAVAVLASWDRAVARRAAAAWAPSLGQEETETGEGEERRG
ncbi:MAG TPA: nucleoside phosphorylase [Actinomycetota bacterium]|nr:nucleoside phosphorylase [Actinomycetota bacterium]